MFGLKPGLGSSLGAIASLAIALPATGQTPLPACQPPRPDEFLLLVQLAAESDRDKLRLALPAEAERTACTYQGNTVARLAGFPNFEIATAQTRLQQLSDRGLAAFVTDSRQVMLLAPRVSLP